jgi:AcrR family transcriptional regulator
MVRLGRFRVSQFSPEDAITAALMDTERDQPPSQPRGRPRDPDLEGRVFDVAIALYADGGWSSFTWERIARAAAVGKAALHRRWQSRGELLHQTLEARWTSFGAIRTDTLAGDLTALAEGLFDSLAGPVGKVMLHMRYDNLNVPEVKAATRPFTEGIVQQARAIVRRAIARGELPVGTSPALIIDVAVGAIMNRFSTTPDHLRPAMIAQRDMMIGDLVALIVRGAGSR